MKNLSWQFVLQAERVSNAEYISVAFLEHRVYWTKLVERFWKMLRWKKRTYYKRHGWKERAHKMVSTYDERIHTYIRPVDFPV